MDLRCLSLVIGITFCLFGCEKNETEVDRLSAQICDLSGFSYNSFDQYMGLQPMQQQLYVVGTRCNEKGTFWLIQNFFDQRINYFVANETYSGRLNDILSFQNSLFVAGLGASDSAPSLANKWTIATLSQDNETIQLVDQLELPSEARGLRDFSNQLFAFGSEKRHDDTYAIVRAKTDDHSWSTIFEIPTGNVRGAFVDMTSHDSHLYVLGHIFDSNNIAKSVIYTRPAQDNKWKLFADISLDPNTKTQANGIAIDSTGQVYVSGTYRVQTDSSSYDAGFIRKYSPDGKSYEDIESYLYRLSKPMTLGLNVVVDENNDYFYLLHGYSPQERAVNQVLYVEKLVWLVRSQQEAPFTSDNYQPQFGLNSYPTKLVKKANRIFALGAEHAPLATHELIYDSARGVIREQVDDDQWTLLHTSDEISY